MQTLKIEDSKTTRKPNLITLVRKLPADLETPVSIYLRLMGAGPSFLLESVTGGEQVARYSFIGTNPTQAFILRGRKIDTHYADGIVRSRTVPLNHTPLDSLRSILSAYIPPTVPGLPRFSGGLVGYLGYETTRYYERSIHLAKHPHLPDAIFLHTDTLVAFDHAYGELLLIANVRINGSVVAAKQEAKSLLNNLERRINEPGERHLSPSNGIPSTELRSNFSNQQFYKAVLAAKEHISAGDIFQVVLSQRLTRETHAVPFNIYRALRRLNPSPYMFYLDFGDLDGGEPFRMIGASPEMHVRLERGLASLRPIAGTRPRGRAPLEDEKYEQDLLADPKERAEHVMLVDLARNDLGRVCQHGSIKIPERMIVERYSHVMHIASHIEGRLRPEYDAFDLLEATFPAGTVSGAPKIRAMQIINNLESDARGPYAGAVGYFAYDGTSDTCITIRTLVMRGQTVSIQAGAGIVADSDPVSEYEETMNKARALAVAVEMAEKMDKQELKGDTYDHRY